MVKNTIVLLISLCYLLHASAQSSKKLSGFLLVHGNKTIYDRTINNNNGGIGAGLKVFYNNSTKFKPLLQIDGNIFGGTKELRLTSSGKAIEAKSFVANVLAGAAYFPVKDIFIEVAAGPAFFNGSSYLALRPSLGIYFSKQQKAFAAVSLTNVFQHDDISDDNFCYINLSVGIKLF